MRRRQYLTATTLAAAGLAGCTGFLESDDGDDPESVVEAYFDALGDGDADTVNELAHADAENATLSEEDGDRVGDTFDYDVEETDLVEETEDAAIVRVEITTSVDVGEETMTATDESEIELRKEDGEWKVYG